MRAWEWVAMVYRTGDPETYDIFQISFQRKLLEFPRSLFLLKYSTSTGRLSRNNKWEEHPVQQKHRESPADPVNRKRNQPNDHPGYPKADAKSSSPASTIKIMSA